MGDILNPDDPGDEFMEKHGIHFQGMKLEIDPELRSMACGGCGATGSLIMMTANREAIAYCSCGWSVKIVDPGQIATRDNECPPGGGS